MQCLSNATAFSSLRGANKSGGAVLTLFRHTTVLFLCIALVLPPLLATAQDRRVAFNEDSSLTTLPPDIAKDIALFNPYPGFLRAILFQTPDGAYIVEVHYTEQGAEYRNEVSLSSKEVDLLRAEVARVIREASRQKQRMNQEGRPRLLWNNLGLSLGFYSWAVPMALGVQDGRTLVATSMLTSGASFFVPYWRTRDTEVTNKAAELGIFGSRYGIAHGYGLGFLLLGEDAEDNPRPLAGVAIATSVLEGTLLYHYANTSRITEGQATLAGAFSNTGLALGGGLAYVTGLTELEDPYRPTAALALAGAGAGFYLGQRWKTANLYTRGDVGVLQTTELLGALVPVTIGVVAEAEDAKPVVLGAMAGSAVGIGVAERLLRGYDVSTGQSWIVALGTAAGGLTTTGLYYLATPDDRLDVKGYMTTMTLGALAGFGFTWYGVRGDTAVQSADNSSTSPAIRVQVSPETYFLSRSLNLPPEARAQLHLVRVGVQF